jgi:hypothetical protein
MSLRGLFNHLPRPEHRALDSLQNRYIYWCSSTFLIASAIEQAYDEHMFEALTELTEDGPSLADFPKVWAAYERLGALLERTVGKHAESGEYGYDGCLTMPAWLRHNCSLSHRAARAITTRGSFLHTHPVVADAAESGRLSAGHVTAIQRNVTSRVADQFDQDHQVTLVAAIEPLPVRDAEHVCKQWRERAEALADLPEPHQPERELSIARTPDGSLHGTLTLEPAAATIVEAALATAATFEGEFDVRSNGQRQADALVDICSWFNANHDSDATPRHRAHVELVINTTDLNRPCCHCTCHSQGATNEADGSDPGTTPTGKPQSAPEADASPYEDPAPTSESSPSSENGPPDRRVTVKLGAHLKRRGAGARTINGDPLPYGSTRAFLCDCVIHRVINSPSSRLDYGRSTRTIPYALFRTVALRDGGCRYPGCDRKISWCEGHHIQHWEHGGPTNPDNIALLCTRHHHLIHQRGWTVRLEAASAELTVTNPYGHTTASHPNGLAARSQLKLAVRDSVGPAESG